MSKKRKKKKYNIPKYKEEHDIVFKIDKITGIRIPVAKPTEFHKSKKKYNRKRKYKKNWKDPKNWN